MSPLFGFGDIEKVFQKELHNVKFSCQSMLIALNIESMDSKFMAMCLLMFDEFGRIFQLV